MERLEYDRYGGPELMRVRAFSIPGPKADEVVVRVAAASINPMDWKIRSGAMKMMTGSKFPRSMGADFAGTVEAVGSAVLDLESGDTVVGSVSMKKAGAFATTVIAERNLMVRKPDGLSFSEASSLPIAGTTAWYVLVKVACLQRGQRLFINGATGAVGRAAIQIARYIGADVVGRVGPQFVAQAQSLGLSLALDYTKPPPPSLNRSFDVVFDANGSLTVKDGDRLRRRGGIIVDIVPTPAKFVKAAVSRSRKVVFADVTSDNLQHTIDLAAAGKLTIPIAQTVSLAEAPALLTSLEQGKRLIGKAVIAF